MIFLDTSAIYALADSGDAKHAEAKGAFTSLIASGEQFITHSYVVVESAALIQRRLGLRQSLAFLKEAERFDVRWVTENMHRSAVADLERRGLSKLSLVDVVSFITMRETGVATYLGFDAHFALDGFRSVCG